jgi:hypothetical protein
MCDTKRRLLSVAICLICLSTKAQQPTPPTAVGETLLHPLSISLGDHLNARSSTGLQALTVRSIGLQIDQKRTAEAAAAETPGLWRASFWKYLPRSSGDSLNSPIAEDDTDSMVTPGYLLLSARLLERKAEASDKTAKYLFAR